MNMSSRRGFTLVELLIVAVLGTVLLMTIYQVVIGNQRIYLAQQAQVQGLQTIRTGGDVLFGELRELSASGGDIVQMGENSLRVRVPRTFGHMCQLPTLVPYSLRVTRTGQPFSSTDSIFIFADNNPNMASDDVWLSGSLSGVDTTEGCPGGMPGQRLTLSALPPLLSSNDIRVGAPVRAFAHFEYGLMQRGSDWYMGRRTGSGDAEPLVGPVRAGTGVRFAYLNEAGAPTTNPVQVRSIRVVIESASDVRDSRGQLVTDSLVTMIYTRN
jgi:prepilin-type N-terminal cleavage/methylation domain-containing protein